MLFGYKICCRHTRPYWIGPGRSRAGTRKTTNWTSHTVHPSPTESNNPNLFHGNFNGLIPYNCVNKRFGAFLSTFVSAIHPSPCRARLLLLSCEGEFEGRIIQPHFQGCSIDILSSGQTKQNQIIIQVNTLQQQVFLPIRLTYPNDNHLDYLS